MPIKSIVMYFNYLFNCKINSNSELILLLSRKHWNKYLLTISIRFHRIIFQVAIANVKKKYEYNIKNVLCIICLYIYTNKVQTGISFRPLTT